MIRFRAVGDLIGGYIMSSKGSHVDKMLKMTQKKHGRIMRQQMRCIKLCSKRPLIKRGVLMYFIGETLEKMNGNYDTTTVGDLCHALYTSPLYRP